MDDTALLNTDPLNIAVTPDPEAAPLRQRSEPGLVAASVYAEGRLIAETSIDEAGKLGAPAGPRGLGRAPGALT